MSWLAISLIVLSVYLFGLLCTWSISRGIYQDHVSPVKCMLLYPLVPFVYILGLIFNYDIS